MNYIDRALVKQQAKNIIKGKFFYIFLVTFIVVMLTNMSVGFNVSNSFNYNLNKNDFEFFNDKKDDYDNFYDYYNGFGEDYDESYDSDNNPIEDFEFDGTSASPEITQLSADKVSNTNALLGGLLGGGIRGVSYLAGFVFSPLLVTLIGMYLSLVRKSPDEPFRLGDELSGVFKNSFNDTYLKKLVVVLLRNVIMSLLMILLIVPGVIFFFSSYFSAEIMSDNPNLKPSEAIRLSKKIVAGNRTELFTLELSFIPWYLLTAVTFGIASVYVLPYVYTTRALYYENFRMRALQNGRITPDDFKSFDEKVSGFTGSGQTYGYTAPSAGASGYYYAPPQNNAQPAGSCYYTGQESDNAQCQVNTDTNVQTESCTDNSSEPTASQSTVKEEIDVTAAENNSGEQTGTSDN